MKKINYLSIIALALLLIPFTSCNDDVKDSTELYNECSSGVVMILNQFYYSIDLGNDNTLYFTEIGEDGELENVTDDQAEISKKMNSAFGSGFFIDNKGTILTNRHVVDPVIDKSQVKLGVINIMTSLNNYCDLVEQELSNNYNVLESQKSKCISYDYYGYATVDQEAIQQINAKQAEIKEQYQKAEGLKALVNSIDMSQVKISPVCKISVAYHNSFVTTPNDFKPCVVTKVSDNDNVDLATIQLKDKKTPDDKHVFTFQGEKNPDNQSFAYTLSHLFTKEDNSTKLTINQQLFMIGYNQGIQLATTSQGIKAQITDGKVSQEPDTYRVMYTISSLHGSSGSPVLNDKGRVVAVNFAGIDKTQNFNFGIPLEQIKKFLNI